MYQRVNIKCERDDFVYESCSQGFKQEYLNNKGNYGVSYEENDKNVKIENNERFRDNEAFGCIVKVETIENDQISLINNTNDSIHLHSKPLTNHNNFNSGVLHSPRLINSGSGEEKDTEVSSIIKEEVDSCEDGELSSCADREDETGLNKQILNFTHKIEIEENDLNTKSLMNVHYDNKLNNKNYYSQGLNVSSSKELTNNTEVYHSSFNLNRKSTALKIVNDTVTSVPDLFQLESIPVIHINQVQINKELNKINSEAEINNLNIKREKDYNGKDNNLDATISSLKCGLCYKAFMDDIAYNSHMTLMHNNENEQLTVNNSIDINAANQHNEKIYNNATVEFMPLKPLGNKVTKYKKQRGSNINKEHSPLNVNEGVYTDLNIDKQQSKVNRKTDIKCTKLDDATNICNSKSKSENITHTDNSNSEKFQYSCDVCNFKTNMEKWMTHHTLLHNENDVDCIFVCDYCHYRTKVKQRLIKHMEKHMLLPYSCKICGYKCKYLYNLIIHTRTHTEKPILCELCNYKCAHMGQLNYHMKTHSDVKAFSCDMCDYKCTLKEYLVRHKRKHTGEKPFSCKICKNRFAWQGDLAKHVRTHSNEKPYSCDMCSYKCIDRSSLTKHKKIHSTEKLYVCKYCPYKCSIKNNLRQHTTLHTGERPYSCKLCSYTGRQHSALVSHMRTHTKEKPYLCNMCDYRAAQITHLKRHMMRHTGEKPFQCRLCPYKSSRKAVLVEHMNVHTKDKPFWCQLCDYKCTKKKLLVKHLNTHTGEEPFACTLCEYKSVERGSLYLHMTVHSGVKPYKCDVCDIKFSDKRCWTLHAAFCLGKPGFQLKESLSAG